MRNAFCEALLKHVESPELVFLTGDLGFMSLEPLQEKLGRRFINAGVAEQNMVSVAAGMAKAGLFPWVYSIAPFLYARAFEQWRNDVCLHDLPVVGVGNGGGYGYGVMGATHHAIEDYGVLAGLRGMRIRVPAFAGDVGPMVDALFDGRFGPVYLRLGRAELVPHLKKPPYASWRKLTQGDGPVLLAAGPLAATLWNAIEDTAPSPRPQLWVVTELPVNWRNLDESFVSDVRRAGQLDVVEEHVAMGGLGSMVALALAERGAMPPRFRHHCAQGYRSGRYGSQDFHRRESGLDAAAIFARVSGAV